MSNPFYKEIGDSKLFRLSFGGLPLRTIDEEEEAIDLVRYAYFEGVDFFDTARDYRNSEKIIGEALKEDREHVFIGTKTHARDIDGIKRDLRASLLALQTDYIDLYQFHTVNTMEEFGSMNSKVMSFLADRLEDETIRNLGFTSHRPKEAAKIIRRWGHWFDSVMVPLSFIETDALGELHRECIENGITLIAMKVLADGRIKSVDKAIRWALNNKEGARESVMAVVGTRSKEHLTQNVRSASELSIDESDCQQLLAETQQLSSRICSRCDQCSEECENGVKPTWVIQYRHQFNQYGWHLLDDKKMERILGAYNCKQCGRCTEVCKMDYPLHALLVDERAKLMKEIVKRRGSE